MTTEIVDIEPTEILLKNMAKSPKLARYVEENNGNVPSFFFEEELITLEEFRSHFEKRIFERLGIKVDLSSPSIDDDDDTPLLSPEEELLLRKACEKWENERTGVEWELSYSIE